MHGRKGRLRLVVRTTLSFFLLVIGTRSHAAVAGDINGDGKVSVPDATTSLQYAVGLITPDAPSIETGDVNGDGILDLKDTILILRVAVGAGEFFDPALYVGEYEGSWTNPTTGATGPARVKIEVDEAAHTGHLTIDIDGNFLGLGDPPALEVPSSYSPSGLHTKTKSAILGDSEVAIAMGGRMTAVFKNPLNGMVEELTYEGRITPDLLEVDYAVKFPDGRTSNSIFRLTKKR